MPAIDAIFIASIPPLYFPCAWAEERARRYWVHAGGAGWPHTIAWIVTEVRHPCSSRKSEANYLASCGEQSEPSPSVLGLPVDNRLMGISEIATLLGVSRRRVGPLAQRDDFTEPVARLAAGPIWNTADVERWARDVGRID